MLPQLTGLGRIALDLFFPRRCLGCGREGSFICFSCQSALPRIAPPVCPHCGLPRPGSTPCPAGVSQRHNIDGIRSPFRFDGVIRQAVHQLKYNNLRAIAGLLAGLLGDYLADHPIPGEALVPVPLHPKRLRERGYNQCYLLSIELGKLVGLPVMADYIARQRYAPPQTRATSASQRHDNVAGAFACRGDLQDKKIILIDDVATSGATLDAGAAALKSAGAGSVWGLTLAREV